MTTATTTTIKPIIADAHREPVAQGNRWQRFHRVMTHTHTYSGRADHGGTVKPPRSYRMLARWAERMGIEAIGMGSPYTPETVEAHHRFDRKTPHLYYSDPTFDQRSLCARIEIERMLEEVNAVS